MMKLWSVVLVALMAVVHVDAEAKRMGGGKSVGQQSSNVTQRESAGGAPSQGGAATNSAAAAKPATPAAAPAAAAPKRPWGAMLLRSQGRADASLPTFSGR